jgi:hypothetical protein
MISKFENADEFNQFMIQKKPTELWLNKFSEKEPYIILSFNDGITFRGAYNKQSLLAGNNSDFRWLYTPGIYAKL